MLLNVHLDILKLLFYSNLSDVKHKVADLASSNLLSACIKCRAASVQIKLKEVPESAFLSLKTKTNNPFIVIKCFPEYF